MTHVLVALRKLAFVDILTTTRQQQNNNLNDILNELKSAVDDNLKHSVAFRLNEAVRSDDAVGRDESRWSYSFHFVSQISQPVVGQERESSGLGSWVC